MNLSQAQEHPAADHRADRCGSRNQEVQTRSLTPGVDEDQPGGVMAAAFDVPRSLPSRRPSSSRLASRSSQRRYSPTRLLASRRSKPSQAVRWNAAWRSRF
jgi:hypothetical protein